MVCMTDPRTVLTDAAYVTIGFGVVAFQQAAVRRRELEEQLGDVRKLVEERVGATVGDVRTRVPDQAVREVVSTAVGAGRDAVNQLLDLVRPAKAA